MLFLVELLCRDSNKNAPSVGTERVGQLNDISIASNVILTMLNVQLFFNQC